MSKRPCMTDYFPSKKPRDQGMAPSPSFRPNRPYRTASNRRWWPTGQRPFNSLNRRYIRTKYGARMRVQQADKPLEVMWRLAQQVLEPAQGDSSVACTTGLNVNTISSHPQFNAFKALYREFKCVKIIDKFRVEKSSEVLTDTGDVDITHWSKWDPAARGRTMDLPNIRASPTAKWKIVKPFGVTTSSLSPVYQDWGDSSDITRSNIRKVDNPWRDLEGTIPDDPSENGIIHLFTGSQRTGSGQSPWRIVREQTAIFLLRYRKDGSNYA